MRKNCFNNKFFKNANILKLGELMNQTKQSRLKKLSVCIRFIKNTACPLVNFGMHIVYIFYIY